MKIILVEPQHPGNVGAVARAMVNFGIDDLALVKGCEIDDDGYARMADSKGEAGAKYNIYNTLSGC